MFDVRSDDAASPPACARSRGLPSTSPSTTTIVSLPIVTTSSSTSRAPSPFRARAVRRDRSASRRRDRISSMSAGRTSCATPTSVSSSRRRGDCEARMTRGVHQRSSQRVTGPSFTSSTCMSAPNSPVSTWYRMRAQQRRRIARTAESPLGPRGVDEARPATLDRVAVERELRDDQHAPADIGRTRGSSCPRRPRTGGAPRPCRPSTTTCSAVSACVNPTSSRNPDRSDRRCDLRSVLRHD